MQGYGFTFDGVHSDTYNIYFEKSYHPVTPPLNAQIQTVPNMPGGWYYRTDLGPRVLQLDIAVVPDSLANFRLNFRQIAAWLDPAKGLKTLSFDNESDVSYQAVLYNQSQAVIINQLVSVGRASIFFLCPDPYAYSSSSSSSTLYDGLVWTSGSTYAVNAKVTNGGNVYKCTVAGAGTSTVAPTQTSGTVAESDGYSWEFLNASGTDSITLEANSSETYPTFTVTFFAAASEFKITNGASGEFVRVIYNFVANDQLSIDCSKGLIQINGNDQMPALDINSDFFALLPGSNSLTVAPLNVADMTVDHTPRYL